MIKIENLKKYYSGSSGFFAKKRTYLKALDSVDLEIYKGETLGLVGESGCGKSTLGKLILRLEDPTEGRIYFEGENIFEYDKNKMRLLRREMQVIFQDPYSSLNFRRRVRQIIEEPFIVHHIIPNKTEREKKVLKLMNEVGLSAECVNRYPHEFSGGQRQRIGIARAIALNPKFIICDEPVSALDVSVQGQVINLLQELQEKYRLTYLFIAHDLGVVEHMSTRIAVMYLGRIVEISTNDVICKKPLHPYTQALISASPVTNSKLKKNRIILEGDVPSPIEPPRGCHFHPRCPKVFEPCSLKIPELKEIHPNHLVRCLLYE